MSRIKEEKIREDRITMEIVVDTYCEEERTMGWYYYLEDKLRFPFIAKCIATRETSPLVIAEEVEVTKMAPQAECGHEMLVTINWQNRSLAVPLDQLKPFNTNNQTVGFLKSEKKEWHEMRKEGKKLY